MLQTLIMSLAGYVFATSNIQIPKDFGHFMDAVALVESGNNPKALGDNGKAWGAWQMHKAAIQDANDWLKANRMPQQEGADLKTYEGQKFLAYAYMLLCKERLERSNVEATYERLYICFAYGFQAFKEKEFETEKVPKRKQEDLQRVMNLYNQRK